MNKNKFSEVKKTIRLFVLLVPSMAIFSCNPDTVNSTKDKEGFQFAKGADLSWLTEMEAAGYNFYDSNGAKKECIQLFKDLGFNSIRLRVWVNPKEGWCNKEDNLAKAERANKLGMRIMVDFHYSDFWADPGKQFKPKAWENLSLDNMADSLHEHTRDVLQALKDKNITPEWVQIGNETTYGMLWDEDESVSGKLTANKGANYTKLSNAGYDAAKSVFPNTKVVVHVDRGQLQELSEFMLATLDSNNGKLDVLGLSLYPEPDNWQALDSACVKNMQWIVDNYGLEVMMCEVGMQWDKPLIAKEFLSDIIAKTKTVKNAEGKQMGLGVFYWEPESYNWKGYSKGAFNSNGTPSKALDAFNN